MKKNLVGIVDMEPVLKREQCVEVEYYITEEEAGDEDYNENKPFGIEVVKKQKIDGLVYKEVKLVRNISADMQIVKNLADILYRNSVTPITVGDVLEDLAVK